MLSWPPTMMKPATLLRMRTRLAIVIWFWTQFIRSAILKYSEDAGDIVAFAERLDGLEVNRELVLSCRLHRQVGWLLALEDTSSWPAPSLFSIMFAARSSFVRSSKSAMTDRSRRRP